ncbi:MAG: glycosyltransferase family 2 protein [Candidatus Diapherotrites archaeon]|nr:glycosyltransferase family 2 protein [Candidatus Diapherotrites archaeon]
MGKSIIVPAYNEEAGIVEVINRCRAVCQAGDEIVVVDDGSKDKTAELAQKAGARVVKLEKNRGKTRALREGFSVAKNEVIVTIDADCTYPPEAIPEMVKALDGADLVVGTRFRKMWPRGLPLHRVLANKVGALVTSIILMRKITDVTTGLRAFRKQLMKEIPIHARGLDFEAELTARAITCGYRYKEVPIETDERKGVSTLRFFRHTGMFFAAVLRGRFGR